MKITNTFEYKPTIGELAEEIWMLDDGEQLKLLSELSDISSSCNVLMQMEYMRESVMNNKGNDAYRNANARKFVDLLNSYLNGEE